MSTLTPRRQFTVDDYFRMAEAGILKESDRVELINGEVRDMSPIGSRHNWVVGHLNMQLAAALSNRAMVFVQSSVRFSKRDMPEPDLTIGRQRPEGYYARQHAMPHDIHWLIEVADSSLQYDRDEKVPYYAEHGIPVVWLVDLVHNQLIEHSDPSPTGYRTSQVYAADAKLSAPDFPDVQIDLAPLFKV